MLSVSLPPESFEPVGAEFITGSVSAPGLVEALQHNLAKDHPLRPIFLQESSTEARPQPAINVSIMHGVRSSLVLQQTGDTKRALAVRNPHVSAHLSFLDVGGHGYSVVRAETDQLEVEFVCIPRPIERSERADGEPLAYQVTHRVKLWAQDSAPRLERIALEGVLPLVL